MALVKVPKASHSPPEFTYDVFLSFRGADTRKGFTDYLYLSLRHAGIETFRDDDEIERGEGIKPELRKAIEQSKMSIIVFSKDYPSSRACLYEVEMILRRSKSFDHGILPVFYDVDPSDLKNSARALAVEAEELERHESRSERAERMKEWSAALKEIASVAGMVLMNQADRHEGKFIMNIIKVVEGKLTFRILRLERHLVGMHSRAKKIILWLRDLSANVGMSVICGMGGIGKTTLAKFVYNASRSSFDTCSFLENIREVSKEPNGLVRLQSQLLADILHNKTIRVHSVEDGLGKIQRALSKKKILLGLDDVEEVDLLDAVFGIWDWFSPGSKIIITTRREGLLEAYEINQVYRVEKLNYDESLELFCWHAFGQKHPQKGYMEQAGRFVHHCDGLPLALKVLGTSLLRKGLHVWDSAFKKLESISDNKVLDMLKISYDSLQDDHDRNLFLDIACFFVGKNRDDTATILDGCEYYTAVGIQNLIDRNLLTIENDKVRIHQLLQDMGRHIVSQESKYPEEHSRLCHHKDSFNVLAEKTGTTRIEGIILNTRMLSKSNEVVFETNAFKELRNLRLLKLSFIQFSGSYEVFPKRLGWLYWHGFSLNSIPRVFPLENVVALDMRYSNLKQAWNGTKVFGSLKILNLSHSPLLEKILDFSRVPNLEKLIVKNCPILAYVDESIVNLDRLLVLNLRDCKKLRSLPRNIHMVKSLEQLTISGCSNLFGVADELRKMVSLRVFRADGIVAHHVLSTMREGALPWYGCFLPWVQKATTSPKISWDSLPSTLVTITLANSKLTDDVFPENFSGLPTLQNLNLSGNLIRELPNCIKDLTNLKTLDLSWNKRLRRIEWPAVAAENLIVTECRLLDKITYKTEMSFQRISHGACMKLDYVQHGFKIQAVSNTDVQLINSIGFFGLESMADLEATIVNVIVWSNMKRPIQILYEHAIFSTYFPGREVPNWFSHKMNGSALSFMVPSFPLLRPHGLNLRLVYTIPRMKDFLPIPIRVRIINRSKDLVGVYEPRCYGVPEADGSDMVWLVHIGSLVLFETDDELDIAFDMMIEGEIKECGAHVLYYDEEEELYQYYNTLLLSWDSAMMIEQLGLSAIEYVGDDEE